MATEEIVSQMIEGVPAFGVKGMPGSGDDHVFGVRYSLGHDF